MSNTDAYAAIIYCTNDDRMINFSKDNVKHGLK